MGMSGRFLDSYLSRVGVIRDQCFVGNVCQYRPPFNDVSLFPLEGSEISEGLNALHQDLLTFNPHICVLLGKTALWAAKRVHNISDWRGSLFISDVIGPFLGRKCIATFHPAACLRQYEWTPLLFFDLRKALRHASTPDLIVPHRDLLSSLSHDQLLIELDNILLHKPCIACDLEGYWNNLSCISIATSPLHSVLIPFTNRDGSSFYSSTDQEVEVWRRFVAIMADARIKKVWQNGLYDRFVLHYGHDVMVYGNEEDTMLKSWEMYCELEKSLAFLCSIYLEDEPYYKSERKTDDLETHFRYCCKDSANTYAISDRLDKLLDPQQKGHYKHNHDLLNPLLYMELRGIRYDSKLAKQRLEQVNNLIYELQHNLNKVAGFALTTTDKQELERQLRSTLCYKRDPTQPKKGNEAALDSCLLLVRKDGLSPCDLGQLETTLDIGLNIKGKALKTYLYETLKLPKQYKTNPKTGEKALSTDYEALLNLSKDSPHPSIPLAIQIGSLRTRSQMLEIHSDTDKRIRCGYNIVGTETGRLTCYTSPTGSGYNLQTIPSENSLLPVSHPLRFGMRDLFVADPDHYLFQCDLSGADGWTVAAYLASLGDTTMLDDYRDGIKPAKVLCYLLRHGAGALSQKSRQEIKGLTQSIEKDSWDYFACKIGQHGSCYLMGKRKLAKQIFIQSEGKVSLSENEAGDLQRLFFIRYRVKLWHDWATRQIRKEPVLIAPNGFKRRFFGRQQEVLGEFLAHLPQVITTYANNQALYRMWTDPENRIQTGDDRESNSRCISSENGHSIRSSVGSCLRAEPLHQVHDSILGQFKVTDTTWAVDKIKQWYNNPIIISDQRITIPFEGTFGTNWAFDSSSKVGNI